MIEVNRIYNEDCMTLMDRMPNCVDVIMTSPFYNSNKKARRDKTLTNTSPKNGKYSHVRYDVHVDNMTDEEYCDFTVRLFEKFDDVLKKDGVILYNLSYGTENVEGMFTAINAIITRTNFTVADCITWKKGTAIPNNVSPNRLTRLVEYIFVICRKDEIKTFRSNKRVKSVRKSGQKNYENIYNFIEADNNDGPCPFNKATYSTELCKQLLNIYAQEDALVFDPFMGTGTTANACVHLGLSFIGSEISVNQCKWAEERVAQTVSELFGDGDKRNAPISR